MKTRDKKITTFYITPELHKEFKSWCQQHGEDMSETLEELMKQHINKTKQDEEEEIDQEALKKRYLKLKREHDKIWNKLRRGKEIDKAWESLGDGVTPGARRKMIPALAEKFEIDKKIPFELTSEIVAFSHIADIRYEMKEILRKLGVSKVEIESNETKEKNQGSCDV